MRPVRGRGCAGRVLGEPKRAAVDPRPRAGDHRSGSAGPRARRTRGPSPGDAHLRLRPAVRAGDRHRGSHRPAHRAVRLDAEGRPRGTRRVRGRACRDRERGGRAQDGPSAALGGWAGRYRRGPFHLLPRAARRPGDARCRVGDVERDPIPGTRGVERTASRRGAVRGRRVRPRPRRRLVPGSPGHTCVPSAPPVWRISRGGQGSPGAPRLRHSRPTRPWMWAAGSWSWLATWPATKPPLRSLASSPSYRSGTRGRWATRWTVGPIRGPGRPRSPLRW